MSISRCLSVTHNTIEILPKNHILAGVIEPVYQNFIVLAISHLKYMLPSCTYHTTYHFKILNNTIHLMIGIEITDCSCFFLSRRVLDKLRSFKSSVEHDLNEQRSKLER